MASTGETEQNIFEDTDPLHIAKFKRKNKYVNNKDSVLGHDYGAVKFLHISWWLRMYY